MTLPKITTKQQAILRLLYRHRFLDRTQIQALLHHKDKRRIIAWLKDLREKQYVEWLYDPNDFAAKTKPAVYYLGLNGVRYLRTLEEYPSEELHKRYKESSRQQPFIDRCLLLADCCVNLEAQSRDGVQYSHLTPADYIDPESDYHFLSELEPSLCFIKQEGGATINYLLEVFDSATPRYKVKKRIKDYVEYIDGGDWEAEIGDNEPPSILLACPSISGLIYVNQHARKLLEESQNDDDMRIRVSTVEKVKASGVTGKIWEEV